MEVTDQQKDKWTVQKMCTDVRDYELTIEKQKTQWQCEHKNSSWKWSVAYHGSILASGSVNSPTEAQIRAKANVPEDFDE